MAATNPALWAARLSKPLGLQNEGAQLTERAELHEIAHSGGHVSFDIKVDAQGNVSYSVQWRHSRPVPAALFAVYAIPQGVAVADIELGGIGTPWNPPPLPDCYPVFISSDSTGMFGHECPSCSGYWRSKTRSRVCPYCALHSESSHQFLTEAQQGYVKKYCDRLNEALQSPVSGTYEIDMDEVADAIQSTEDKPHFYYAEERQQNYFECESCGQVNDVLGTYAYCGTCATRNDIQIFGQTIEDIRDRIKAGGSYEACAKDAVAAFDSFAGHYAAELRRRIPLSPRRNARLDKARFHDLGKAAELFRTIFDIDILSGIDEEQVQFATRMFHRRHIYEHKGGEADRKYIEDSGDNVRPKQALRESQESAHQIANTVARLASNLHKGFHQIFPPFEDPIAQYQKRHGKN